METSNDDITIVTAIYHYSYYSRMGGRNYSFEFYENPFRNLLSLGANIVVFSHQSEIPKVADFFARSKFHNFRIIDYDLEHYRLSNEIYALKEKMGIINESGLVDGVAIFANDRNTHLCLSKIDFLEMAIRADYFNSERFFWIDAGLFHNGIIPHSIGGMERFLKPDESLFWPNNANNICRPSLLRNFDGELNFCTLVNSFSTPNWWNKITFNDSGYCDSPKTRHVIGGIFGGTKSSVIKLCKIFNDTATRVIESGELTLEEDVLSIIVAKNTSIDVVKERRFETWYHDVRSDSCYTDTGGLKGFYKVFTTTETEYCDYHSLQRTSSSVPEPNASSHVTNTTTTNETMRKYTVYIFGDSHCTIFLDINSRINTVVAGYDGASISGLDNKNSRLEYGSHIKSLIIQNPSNCYFLLKLGQVDVEFNMYYKIYVKGETFTFTEFCQGIIEKYRKFIIELLAINTNIVIASINLPSYYDSVDIRAYIARIIGIDQPEMSLCPLTNLTTDPILSDFSVSQLTKNFRYFNTLLENLAIQLGVPFFDTTEITIDKTTGILREEFRDYGHHYNRYTDKSSIIYKLNSEYFTKFFEKQYLKTDLNAV